MGNKASNNNTIKALGQKDQSISYMKGYMAQY